MNTKKAQFSVRMSTELVGFLGKVLPHRTSRIEAYTDLLNEQIKLLRIDFKGGSSVPFLVTITDLLNAGIGAGQPSYATLILFQESVLSRLKDAKTAR